MKSQRKLTENAADAFRFDFFSFFFCSEFHYGRERAAAREDLKDRRTLVGVNFTITQTSHLSPQHDEKSDLPCRSLDFACNQKCKYRAEEFASRNEIPSLEARNLTDNTKRFTIPASSSPPSCHVRTLPLSEILSTLLDVISSTHLCFAVTKRLLYLCACLTSVMTIFYLQSHKHDLAMQTTMNPSGWKDNVHVKFK